MTKDSPEATRNGIFSRLMSHLAKATPAEIAEIVADAGAVAKSGEGVATPLSHTVDDLWTGSQPTKVGENLNINSSSQAARGSEASPAAAHSDFVGQKGIEEVATRLGQMINGMGAMVKAIEGLQANAELHGAAIVNLANHLSKGVPIVAVKAEDEKKDDKNEKEDKMDKDGKPNFAKSAIDAVLAEIAPLVETAKSHAAEAAEFKAGGMADSASATQLVADRATLKATKLFAAAKALDPTHPTVVELAKSLDVAKEPVQEAAKAEPVVTADIGKGAPEISAVEKAEIEKALSGIGMLQGKMSDIMDILGGKKTVGDIVKSVPSVIPSDHDGTLKSYQTIILAKSAAGDLDSSEVAQAMDLATIFDGERQGIVPKGIFEQKALLASDRVRPLFAKAA